MIACINHPAMHTNHALQMHTKLVLLKKLSRVQ